MLEIVDDGGGHDYWWSTYLPDEIGTTAKAGHSNCGCILKRREDANQPLVVDKHPFSHMAILKIGLHGSVCGDFAVEFDHSGSHMCQKHITDQLASDMNLMILRRHWFDAKASQATLINPSRIDLPSNIFTISWMFHTGFEIPASIAGVTLSV